VKPPALPLRAGLISLCLVSCSLLIPGEICEKTAVSAVLPDGTLSGQGSCTIQFSTPMNRASVERSASLFLIERSGETGAQSLPERRALRFRWLSDSRLRLDFPEPMPAGACELIITEEAESRGGTDLSPAFIHRFPGPPQDGENPVLIVMDTIPPPGSALVSGSISVDILFSRPVAERSIISHLEHYPRIPLTFESLEDDRRWRIASAAALPRGSTLQIRLNEGMEPVSGFPLSGDRDISFTIDDPELPVPDGMVHLNRENSTALLPPPACNSGFDRSSVLRFDFPRSLGGEEQSSFEGLCFSVPDIRPGFTWEDDGNSCSITFDGPVGWKGYYTFHSPPGNGWVLLFADGEAGRPVTWEWLRINGTGIDQGDPFPVSGAPLEELRLCFSHSAEASLDLYALLDAVSFSISGGGGFLVQDSCLTEEPAPGITELIFLADYLPDGSEGILAVSTGGWLKDSLGNPVTGLRRIEISLGP
jgi:hypothetical protein